jgi:hypothetical protein
VNGSSEIKATPNPAPEGGTVTITFPHGGPWFVHVDGGTGWVEIGQVDPATNTVTIDVPALGGGSFTVSDQRIPPDGISIPVEGNNSCNMP